MRGIELFGEEEDKLKELEGNAANKAVKRKCPCPTHWLGGIVFRQRGVRRPADMLVSLVTRELVKHRALTAYVE